MTATYAATLPSIPRSSSSYPSSHSSGGERLLQIVTITASSITILVTLVTVYMFHRMLKRFRHNLIMLSILGCFVRDVWYFIASAYDLANGDKVDNGSIFCQASGFFIRLGNGITDFATMFIAIHVALQVFRPAVTNLDADDGIYAYRLYAYLATLLVPTILSSLPFINKDGYISQGVFCSLPRSSLWSRVVLIWLPRFIIAMLVIGLAIGVYAHVARQLGEFSTSQRSSGVLVKGGSVVGGKPPKTVLPFPKRKQDPQNHLAGIDEEEERRKSSAMSMAMHAYSVPVKPPPPILHIPQYNQGPTERAPITPGLVSPGAVSQGPDIFKNPDYFSIKPLAPILKVPQYSQGSALTPITPGLVSPGSTPYRRSPVVIKGFAQADYFDIQPPTNRQDVAESEAGAPVVFTHPWDKHGQLPQHGLKPSNSAHSTRTRHSTPPGGRALGRRVSIEEPAPLFAFAASEAPRNNSLRLAEDHNDVQRNAVKKGLRQVFVYPAIFVVFWIPPCVKNMLALSKKRTDNHPVWLAVLSTLCLTLMGTAYCLVFLWSEQPWRHFVGRSRLWKRLRILWCLNERATEEEDGHLESPSVERRPSFKPSSFVSDNTGHTSQVAAQSQVVTRSLSKNHSTESIASGQRNSVISQHGERGGSTTSLASTTAASRTKSISFATMGQHLAGGSTTGLAKQLALERLNLEQQDRRNELNFRRRLSMHSRASRMSSRASGVTSLSSVTEVMSKEWWDKISEAEHSDDDFGGE